MSHGRGVINGFMEASAAAANATSANTAKPERYMSRYTTAVIASSIKAKDELTLEYKLDSVETAKTVISNSAKAKAKSDGEDILTPVVETSAQAIVSTVAKK